MLDHRKYFMTKRCVTYCHKMQQTGRNMLQKYTGVIPDHHKRFMTKACVALCHKYFMAHECHKLVQTFVMMHSCVTDHHKHLITKGRGWLELIEPFSLCAAHSWIMWLGVTANGNTTPQTQVWAEFELTVWRFAVWWSNHWTIAIATKGCGSVHDKHFMMYKCYRMVQKNYDDTDILDY